MLYRASCLFLHPFTCLNICIQSWFKLRVTLFDEVSGYVNLIGYMIFVSIIMVREMIALKFIAMNLFLKIKSANIE